MKIENEHVADQDHNNPWSRNKYAENAVHGEFFKRVEYKNKAEKCAIFIGFYKLNDKVYITFNHAGKRKSVNSSDKNLQIQFIHKIDSDISLGECKNEILDLLHSYTKPVLVPNWMKTVVKNEDYEGYNFTNKNHVEAELFIGWNKYANTCRRVGISGDQELISKIIKICKKSFLDESFLHTYKDCCGFFLESSKDIGLLATVLNVIDSILPLHKEIKNIAFDTFNIKIKSFRQEELLRLKEITNTLSIEELIKKARQIESENTFWELANHCESLKKYDYACTLYQEIAEENPYYQKSIERIIYILRQYLDSEISETEKDEAKKNQFKFMALSQNPDKQRWLDLAFHELSGAKDFNPVIKVKLNNIDTLISSARLICTFRSKFESSQTELGQANAKIKELTEKLQKKAFVDNKNIPFHKNEKKSDEYLETKMRRRMSI